MVLAKINVYTIRYQIQWNWISVHSFMKKGSVLFKVFLMQVRGTIFNELDDDRLHNVIDFTDFEERFKIGTGGAFTNGDAEVDGLSSFPSKRFKRTENVSLLEHTRLRNIGKYIIYILSLSFIVVPVVDEFPIKYRVNHSRQDQSQQNGIFTVIDSLFAVVRLSTHTCFSCSVIVKKFNESRYRFIRCRKMKYFHYGV